MGVFNANVDATTDTSCLSAENIEPEFDSKTKYTKVQIDSMRKQIAKSNKASSTTIGRRKIVPKAANNGKQRWDHKYEHLGGLKRIVYHPDPEKHKMLNKDVHQQALDMWPKYQKSKTPLWKTSSPKTNPKAAFVDKVKRDYCSWWSSQNDAAKKKSNLELMKGAVSAYDLK